MDAKSPSVFELCLALLELLHLVHRNVLVHQLVHLLVHLLRQLPARDSPEAHDQEDHEEHHRDHSKHYPVGQMRVRLLAVLAAATRTGTHAVADHLEHFGGLEVAAVDEAVDDDARVIVDVAAVFLRGEVAENRVVLLCEGAPHVGCNHRALDAYLGQDLVGAFLEDCQIIAAVIELQHVVPPFAGIDLKNVILSELFLDDFLSPVLNAPKAMRIPAILAAVEAVGVDAAIRASSGRIGDLKVD